MSRWQRPHISLVMKKFAGIVPFTLVFDEDGKNGLAVPAPSSSMVRGGTSGFAIANAMRRLASYVVRCAAAQMPATITTVTIPYDTTRNCAEGLRLATVANQPMATADPITPAAMCARSSPAYGI